MNKPIYNTNSKVLRHSGKHIIFLMMSLLFIGSFTMCMQPKAIQKTISSGEAVEMIKNNGNKTHLTILDVRTPQEYAEGHIAGATNIDVNAEDFVQKINKLDKSKGYLVYCRSGHRSANAFQIMKEQSFKTIYNLDGGITKWMSDKNPVVK